MGKLDVHISHGGSDGGGKCVLAVVLVAAVLFSGAGAGAAASLAAVVAELLFWLAGVAGVAAVVAVVVWLATRGRREQRQLAADAYRAQVEERDRQQDLERHRRRLEIAAASATKIYNVIDPAALGLSQPPVQRVLRGEVER